MVCLWRAVQWHALDKSEQARYYEMARKEKELHMQLYPGWSARDNYGLHSKKKRKLRGTHWLYSVIISTNVNGRSQFVAPDYNYICQVNRQNTGIYIDLRA